MIFLYMLIAHIVALHVLAFAIYLFPAERHEGMPLAIVRKDLRSASLPSPSAMSGFTRRR
jgi:hypothetical protein